MMKMDGLSIIDPEKYRKINYVLNDKGITKEDFLDKVETVPLEYAYNIAAKGPTAFDTTYLAELKAEVTRVLASLTPREERVLRKRFGIGLKKDETLAEVGKEFGLISERIRQIEAKALRKLKHPSRSRKMKGFLDK